MRQIRLLAAIILTLAFLCTAATAAAVKFKTSGTFSDSGGTDHLWSINDAHTLIWENQPYLPVGAVFVAKSLAANSPQTCYDDDIAALQQLKSKGITDIALSGSAPISAADPAALQKIITFLDSNGFTYGIELNDGPKEALVGYLVALGRYKLDGPGNAANLSFAWPDVDSAISVVVNRTVNQVDSIGGAAVRDGKVAINLGQPLTSSQVLLVLPRKSLGAPANGGVGDVWSGFNEYRDRLVDFLKKVKFGPGLRFFMDPFRAGMDFHDDMVGFIPDSAGFRVGFEAYLAKKRVHEGSVNAAWGLNETIDSIQTAARLVPLWGFGRGVSYAYDRATARMYPIDTTVSEYWRDLIDYRDTSAQEYMNTISDTLRKQVANVPVVFKGSSYHRIYSNPFGYGGFDGLAASACGADETTVGKAAGPVYALAEESGKSTWFVATAQGSDAKTASGYASETSMAASLDLLRELGAKGVFVEGLNGAQADWLKGIKDKVKTAQAVDFKPDVINYPIVPLSGAYPKRVARNTWWLPTLRTGQISFVGEGLGAYTISGEDRTYLWSGSGNRTITLKAGPTGMPTLEYPQGKSISKKKDGSFTVEVGAEPTVLRGMEFDLVFPYETVSAEIGRLADMIPEADKAGMAAKKFQESLDRAKAVLAKGQPLVSYGIAQSSIQEMLAVIGADIWMEGEASSNNSFDRIEPMFGASANLALVVDTPDSAPMTPYTAGFGFDAPSNSSFEIWVAGTPPSDGSPVSYAIDDAGWTQVAAEAGSLQNYAPGLSWYKIGTVNLRTDKHTIKFRIDGKRPQGDKYYFAIDTVVLSPKGFKPNGVTKPF